MSAQTFEEIAYSDRELRNQLKLLAADSIGILLKSDLFYFLSFPQKGELFQNQEKYS